MDKIMFSRCVEIKTDFMHNIRNLLKSIIDSYFCNNYNRRSHRPGLGILLVVEELAKYFDLNKPTLLIVNIDQS